MEIGAGAAERRARVEYAGGSGGGGIDGSGAGLAWVFFGGAIAMMLPWYSYAG